MRLAILSTLSLLSFGLMASASVNNVYIDADSSVVCLILPPAGKIIGDTQTIGHVQCTNGTGSALLPKSFFATKQFKTTDTYVQAWGLMNDASVGLLTSDGGGQYDIHADSGDNRAPGWAVFVELLEPDSGRWCIRFCHALGTDCNMGKSSAGCEGALGITDWPTAAEVTTTAAAKTTSAAKTTATATVSATNKTTVSTTVNGTATSTVLSAGASTVASGSSSSATGSSKVSQGSYKATLGAIVPVAVMASAVYSLFL